MTHLDADGQGVLGRLKIVNITTNIRVERRMYYVASVIKIVWKMYICTIPSKITSDSLINMIDSTEVHKMHVHINIVFTPLTLKIKFITHTPLETGN